jgi:hypothetical protein
MLLLHHRHADAGTDLERRNDERIEHLSRHEEGKGTKVTVE